MPVRRRGRVVLAMVTMGITGVIWWEMEPQRAGSNALLRLARMPLPPGGIVRDVAAVVSSSGSGGARAEDWHTCP